MNIYNNDIEPIKIIEEDKYIVFLIKLLKKANLENLFIEKFISNIKSRNIVVDEIFSLNDATPLKLEFGDDKGTLLIITKNFKYSDCINQDYIEELYELRNIKEIFWIFLNNSHVNIKHFNKKFGCEDISISDWEVVE